MSQEIYNVSQLTKLIKRQLEPEFRNIFVEGEISNVHKATNTQHIYFTIKDENASIRAVIFGGISRFLTFEMKEGLHVIARADISVYAKRGEYQLIVRSIEPKGIGSLKLAFEQLKKKLEAEGLFDEKHKKALPMLPRRIGAVTSITGAAIKDIINVLFRRFGNVQLVIRSAKVQGMGAAQDIADAIREFNEYGEVDVLIVGRGGGSFEDLFAFNEEPVARAIYESKIPIISAVGHQRDFSIADFVADLRAPTPSAAAELVVKNKQELQTRISHLMESINGNLQTRMERIRNAIRFFEEKFVTQLPKHFFINYQLRLDELARHIEDALDNRIAGAHLMLNDYEKKIIGNSPVARLKVYRERFSSFESKFSNYASNFLAHARGELSLRTERLNAYNPLNVLSRGYSITFSKGHKIIKTVAGLNAGDEMITKLVDGEILSRVL